MTSQRKQRLRQEWRARKRQAFDDLCNGIVAAFGRDPRKDATLTPIRDAFACLYPALEWCRLIRRTGSAGIFLKETHSALVSASVLAATGFYEVAHQQLRYASECVVAFLYFRDHPRELELAGLEVDLWDSTRPSAAIEFLRKLPEFNHAVGKTAFGELTKQYRELSAFVHPRVSHAMGQRLRVADLAPKLDAAESFARACARLFDPVCGILWLACHDELPRANEVTQELLKSGTAEGRRRKIAAQLASRNT